MSTPEVHGPIDFIVMEFPGDKITGEVADRVVELIDSGIVRLYDLLIVRKAQDGTFEGVALDTGEIDGVGGFAAFSGARSGLLGDDDLEAAANAMQPGTIAAVLVFENTWAIPFVAAALRAGGEVIASARIPAADVMAALDELDAAG